MATDRRRRRRRLTVDHGRFTRQLAERFPEVVPAIRPESAGLLHLQMSDFRQVVEAAMDVGRHWRVYQYLCFLDGCLDDADDYVANAIAVSFIEEFALGQRTAERYKAVRERMPDRLRRRLVAVDDRWR